MSFSMSAPLRGWEWSKMHLSLGITLTVWAYLCVRPAPVVASVDLTPYVTATQDGGTAKTNFAWYEQGFNGDHPNLGLPHAGVIHGEADPQSTFLLRPYTAN